MADGLVTKGQKMERATISMEPTDWAVVFQVSKDFGLGSRSAGVRFIIRDWQRLKRQALQAEGRRVSPLGG